MTHPSLWPQSIVSVRMDGASIVAVCHFCTGIPVLLSLSQAFEVVGNAFVLLTRIGRQRLRRLRPHFQVSNGYFNYIYYLLFNPISDLCALFCGIIDETG